MRLAGNFFAFARNRQARLMFGRFALQFQGICSRLENTGNVERWELADIFGILRQPR